MDYLYTDIDLTSSITATAVFSYHFNGAYGHIGGVVEVSLDGGMTWIYSETLATGLDWQTGVFSLDTYVGQVVTLGFHSDDGGTWAAGFAVDDVGICKLDGP